MNVLKIKTIPLSASIKSITSLLICYFIFTSYFSEKKENPWRPLNTREKEEVRKNLVQTAEEFIRTQPKTDCSGLIQKIFKKNNIIIFKKQALIPEDPTGVKIMYNTLRNYKKIYINPLQVKKGDLIFFSNTYDMNKNNKIDDILTHIGMVIDKDKEGTITFIHSTSKKIKYDYINLKDKHNKKVNSFLRVKHKQDPMGTKYLTGELFTCFGTLF